VLAGGRIHYLSTSAGTVSTLEPGDLSSATHHFSSQ
jgi:hypothetical protein